MRGGWGVAMAHMDSSPVFCTLHSISLILFFLPSSLPLLSCSLSPSQPLSLALSLSHSLSCSWHWPDMLQQQSSLAH